MKSVLVLGKIPKKKEEIKFKNYKIIVEDVTEKHIKRVRVIKN